MVLIGFLAIFQYQCWRGNGNIYELLELKNQIKIQKAELQALTDRNQALDKDLQLLKQFPLACEERARYELGMIKEGETFFLVVEPMR
jgi:cell division protein FtsB